MGSTRLKLPSAVMSGVCSFSGRVLEKSNDDATAIPVLRYLRNDSGQLFCNEGRAWNGQELNGQLDDHKKQCCKDKPAV